MCSSRTTFERGALLTEPPGGGLVARPDLLYPEAGLAIEYDGATHRDTLVADNRRQNRLLAAGYSVLRYTGADVFGRPDAILEEVRGQLSRRRSA